MESAGEPSGTSGMDRGDVLRLGGLLVALLVVVGIVLLAGAGGGSSKPSGGQARGVIISVDEGQLVLDPEAAGAPQTFRIRPQDLPKLDLFHLRQHAADQLPSIVYYETVRGTRYATQVDDA